MKLHTVIAPTTQKAMMSIYNDFGPDTVIYRTQELSNGVEVLFGLPDQKYEKVNVINKPLFQYDDEIEYFPEYKPETVSNHDVIAHQISSLKHTVNHLGSMLEKIISKNIGSTSTHTPSGKQMWCHYLEKMGFSSKFCEQHYQAKLLEGRFKKIKKNDVLKQLGKLIPTTSLSLQNIQGIHALIGPTGVGKTTTVIKLAKQFIKMHGAAAIGIVTIDPEDTNSKSLLMHYCKNLKIDLEYASNKVELVSSLTRMREKRLILIDTYGVSQRNISGIHQLVNMLSVTEFAINIHLTMSCTAQEQVLEEIVSAFNITNIGECILTKLDESVSISPAISVSINKKMPIGYICNGQNMDDDIFTAQTKDMLRYVETGDFSTHSAEDHSILSYFKKAAFAAN